MLSILKEKSRVLVDIIFNQLDAEKYSTEVLGTICSLNIHLNDVRSFSSQLNDQAINAYCELLAREMDQTKLHAKVIDSFILMDMIRNKRMPWGITKDDINTYDILFGCANEAGRHWIAIILDTRKHTFTCMDSLNEFWSTPTRKLRLYFQNFNASAQEKGLGIWKLSSNIVYPVQDDGSSCGIYALTYLERFLKKRDVNQPILVEETRRQMAIKIIEALSPKNMMACYKCYQAPINMRKCVVCLRTFHKENCYVGRSCNLCTALTAEITSCKAKKKKSKRTEGQKSTVDASKEGEKSTVDASTEGQKSTVDASKEGEKSTEDAKPPLKKRKTDKCRTEGEKSTVDASKEGEKSTVEASTEGQKSTVDASKEGEKSTEDAKPPLKKRKTDKCRTEGEKSTVDASKEGEKSTVDASTEGQKSTVDASKEGEKSTVDASKEGEKSTVDASTEGQKSTVDASKEGEKSTVDASTEGQKSTVDASKEGEKSTVDASTEGQKSTVDASKEGEKSTVDASTEGQKSTVDASKEGEKSTVDASTEGQKSTVDASKEGEKSTVDASTEGQKSTVDASKEGEKSTVDATRRPKKTLTVSSVKKPRLLRDIQTTTTDWKEIKTEEELLHADLRAIPFKLFSSKTNKAGKKPVHMVTGKEVIDRYSLPEEMSLTQIGDYLSLSKSDSSSNGYHTRKELGRLLGLIERPTTSNKVNFTSAWSMLTNGDVEYQIQSLHSLTEAIINKEKIRKEIWNGMAGTPAQKTGDMEKIREVIDLITDQVNKTDLNKAMHGEVFRGFMDVLKSLLPSTSSELNSTKKE